MLPSVHIKGGSAHESVGEDEDPPEGGAFVVADKQEQGVRNRGLEPEVAVEAVEAPLSGHLHILVESASGLPDKSK